MTKNKIGTEKNIKIFLYIKNYDLPIPRPTKRISKLPKKPSTLKREHPALQNMKFLIFLPSIVGHCCPPGSGSGFRIGIRIRIQ
jgi:hypothetical protein